LRGGHGQFENANVKSEIGLSWPRTTAKVLLNTTVGPIEINLFARECPRTVSNFLQLIMEGYYDGAPFHRVIKGHIVETGDPRGKGSTLSVWNKPLPLEQHPRLTFRIRGLVAMADRGTQFFITCEDTPQYDGKTTIFGLVRGESLFTVINDIATLKTDDEQKPLKTVNIIHTEILENPFKNLRPRPLEERKYFEGDEDGQDEDEEMITEESDSERDKQEKQFASNLGLAEYESETESTRQEEIPKNSELYSNANISDENSKNKDFNLDEKKDAALLQEARLYERAYSNMENFTETIPEERNITSNISKMMTLDEFGRSLFTGDLNIEEEELEKITSEQITKNLPDNIFYKREIEALKEREALTPPSMPDKDNNEAMDNWLANYWDEFHVNFTSKFEMSKVASRSRKRIPRLLSVEETARKLSEAKGKNKGQADSWAKFRVLLGRERIMEDEDVDEHEI